MSVSFRNIFLHSVPGTVPCQITVLSSKGSKVTRSAASFPRSIPCPCLECGIMLLQLIRILCTICKPRSTLFVLSLILTEN